MVGKGLFFLLKSVNQPGWSNQIFEIVFTFSTILSHRPAGATLRSVSLETPDNSIHLQTQAFIYCVDLTIYNDYCRVRLAVVLKNSRKIPESLSSGGAGTLHSPLFRAQVYQLPARLDI